VVKGAGRIEEFQTACGGATFGGDDTAATSPPRRRAIRYLVGDPDDIASSNCLDDACPAKQAGSCFMLTPFPLAKRILAVCPLPLFELAVHVRESEQSRIARLDPPLHQTPDRGAATPAVRVAAA
jgi:hypothetical protein